MTAAEKQALALIYGAGISVDTWADRVQHGYRGKPYNYKATAYYKALKILRDAGAGGNPTPTPNPPPSSGLAQSIIFLAQNPQEALVSPTYYKLACTADLGYRSFYTASFFQEARAQGRKLYAWCDCRPSPDGTPPEVAKQMVSDFGLDGWIGQGERADEFDYATGAGAKVIVGNINSLRADQRAKIADGSVLWTQEYYANCGDGAPDFQGLPIAGLTVAVYGDGQCHRKPLAEYIAEGHFVAHRDSVYGPGMTTADWAVLK